MGIVINDLETKGYETLIYKQAENVWEETRENLLLLLYHITTIPHFQGKSLKQITKHQHFQVGTKVRNIDDHKIQDIHLINYYHYGEAMKLIDTLAENLREDSTNDEVTAALLNDTGKHTKIYTKKSGTLFNSQL